MKDSLLLAYFVCLLLPSPTLLQQKTAICVKEKFLKTKMSVSRLDSFHALISHSDVFVDKSLLIKEILLLNRKIVLITRPHGWGKSVNLDLLRLFFGIEVDSKGVRKINNETKHHEIFCRGGYTFHGKFEKLENLLLISEHKDIMKKYLGKFPVIYVRFNQVRGNNFRMLLSQLRDVITKAFREHSYMMHVFDQIIKSNSSTNSKKYRMGKHANLFRKFMHDEKTSLDRIQKSLQFLSKVLREYFYTPPYIIMDGYDVLLRHMFSNESFPKNDISKFITFYTSFIQTTFKYNPYIDKGILAGELQLLNSTLFPRNKNETDLDDEFPDFFGFTKDELKGMCERAKINDLKCAKAHEWYYGYEASKRSSSFVYNPWSIAHFVKSKKIRDYWIDENDPNEHLEAFIRFSSFREKFISLVYRNNITMNPKNLHFDGEDFTQLQNFMRTKKRERFSGIVTNLGLSFLWSHGYLSTVYDHKTNFLRLRIPNKEIEEHFRIFLAIYLRDELGINDKKKLLPLLRQFQTFVNNDEMQDEVLEDHLRTFFRMRSKRLAINKPRLAHALLNYLVLYTDFDRRFGSEGLTQDIPDVKMLSEDYGVIIEFVWDLEVFKALENAKKFDKIFYKNIEIRTIKFIGINFKSDGKVEVHAEIMTNPYLGNDTTGSYTRTIHTTTRMTLSASSSEESDESSSPDESGQSSDFSEESQSPGSFEENDEPSGSYDENAALSDFSDENLSAGLSDESAISKSSDQSAKPKAFPGKSAIPKIFSDKKAKPKESSGDSIMFAASSEENNKRFKATTRFDRRYTPIRTSISSSNIVTSVTPTASSEKKNKHFKPTPRSDRVNTPVRTSIPSSNAVISTTLTTTTPLITASSFSQSTTLMSSSITTLIPLTSHISETSTSYKTKVTKSNSSVSRRTRKPRTKSSDQGDDTIHSETITTGDSAISRSRRTRVTKNSTVGRKTRKPKTLSTTEMNLNDTTS